MGDHNAEARRMLLNKGKALPNPGEGPPRFPIADENDLRKAIKLANSPRVRAFVMKRARALGRTDLIPDGWQSSK